jgi:LPS-assembly protein
MQVCAAKARPRFVISINKMNPILLSAMAILMLAGQTPAFAASPENTLIECPGPSLAPKLRNMPDRESARISLKSRSFTASPDADAEALGQVELRRADQLLLTEILRYNPQSETVTIPGHLSYTDSVLHISGSDAQYSFLDENGHFSNVDYGLTGSSANGTAAEILVSSNTQSVLRDLYFSTCPGEDPEWVLTADELELDFDTGVGKARKAKLEFFDFPILYLPYMTFPITNQRKSGFLYPTLSTANDNGFEFGIPYYWNIAPNQDATIKPRYFTERGAMLTGEYRFITRKTGGRLDFDFMPDDRKTDDHRYHYRFEHNTLFTKRWTSNLVFDRVSDDQYFQDFSNSLAGASRQYLRSKAGIYGSGQYWTLSAFIDDFQVVDEAVVEFNEPHRRLPRITFDLDRPWGSKGLRLRLDTELVYFDRDQGVTGWRMDLFPRLEWNFETSWGYMRPSAGYRYTTYELDRRGGLGDESPDRGLSIVSFDTGLFMERYNKNGNIQMLEPRLFYLYVPHRDQADLPDFDTAPYTFGFSQLFHFNRFTGADRQADANQLTVALTTRSINQKLGRELWSLSFGQIIYFEDQRVRLLQNETLETSESPFIAEFILHPTKRLSSRIGAQWNWQTNEFDVAVVGVTHRASNGTRFGAEYRFRRNSLDQFDLRYYQPVNANWRVLGRVNYSLKDSDLLAAEAGFEYDSCCWGIRVVAKRFLRNRDGDHRDALYVELFLKGLTNIGRSASPLFYDLAN